MKRPENFPKNNSKRTVLPFKHIGSKAFMATYIVPNIKKGCKFYVEPFVGAGALFFSFDLPEFDNYFINDIDLNIVNFYTTVKERPGEFYNLLEKTVISEALHKKHVKILNETKLTIDDIPNTALAYSFFYSRAFGLKPYFKKFTNINKRGAPIIYFYNYKNIYFDLIKKRLEKAVIYSSDALKILKNFTGEHCFYFLDPPYIDTLQPYNGEEYTKDDLIRLLDFLQNKTKAYYILTHVYNDIISDFIKNENISYFIVQRFSRCFNKVKILNEVVLANYPIYPPQKTELKIIDYKIRDV